jgi:hypothetical protein
VGMAEAGSLGMMLFGAVLARSAATSPGLGSMDMGLMGMEVAGV